MGVLDSCSSGVQNPLRAVAAIWVTENPRGSFLEQPNSEGLSENVGRSFHSLAKPVVSFLDCNGSCRELTVLCIFSARVWLPPWAGATSWAAVNPRDSSPGQPYCPRIRQIFSQPSQACFSFSGVQGELPGAVSPLQLSSECAAPLRVGAASWAAANPRGSSPGQADWEKLPEN